MTRVIGMASCSRRAWAYGSFRCRLWHRAIPASGQMEPAAARDSRALYRSHQRGRIAAHHSGRIRWQRFWLVEVRDRGRNAGGTRAY